MNIKDFQNGYVLGLATQQIKEEEVYLHTKIDIYSTTHEQDSLIYTSNYPEDLIPIDSTAKGVKFTFSSNNSGLGGTPKLILFMRGFKADGSNVWKWSLDYPQVTLPEFVSIAQHSEEIYLDISDKDLTDIANFRFYIQIYAIDSGVSLAEIKISNVEVVY